MYVCGMADDRPIPMDPLAIEANDPACDVLFSVGARLSSHLAEAKIVKKQACFRPIVADGLPLLGAVTALDGVTQLQVTTVGASSRTRQRRSPGGANQYRRVAACRPSTFSPCTVLIQGSWAARARKRATQRWLIEHENRREAGVLRALDAKLVGTEGFEPPTPTTPLWCATRLRYAPTRTLNLPVNDGHDHGDVRHVSRLSLFASRYSRPRGSDRSQNRAATSLPPELLLDMNVTPSAAKALDTRGLLRQSCQTRRTTASE